MPQRLLDDDYHVTRTRPLSFSLHLELFIRLSLLLLLSVSFPISRSFESAAVTHSKLLHRALFVGVTIFSPDLIFFWEMGFVSRKIFPACCRMCICCPALKPRSRQPIKRYKKLVADIFPKSLDGQPSERKMVKLSEYAAKNPLRIPKITKLLEDRLQKELRSGHIKIVCIIMEVYNKLLSNCGKQMAYYAGSLLNTTAELLDSLKQDSLHIAGCETLTKFIYTQSDGTYTHAIENLVRPVCLLARESGEGPQKRFLRASSLQCLAAMVWFMTEYSYFFDDFDEIVHVTLDNYVPQVNDENGELEEQPHQWVDEVVRCDGRGGAAIGDTSAGSMVLRPRPEKKDPSLLTREENESPKIWAQICLQRMAELAKESTTMRQVLEPMFVYFDNGHHWVPQQGLAVKVLSDLCYFVEISENQLLVMVGVVHHLDHKNVSHDPWIKSHVIQVATHLARQIRVETTLVDFGCVSDLCRNLRKSLQATAVPTGEEESKWNVQLQNSIEACLLEIAKGMKDSSLLFDLMVITLEKLAPVGVVSRATMCSLIVLAHVFSVVSLNTYSQQVFPEALVVQLLKAMLHPDPETRVAAHKLFSILLFPCSYDVKHDATSFRSGYCYESRKWQSSTAAASTFASVEALLEKLRKEKGGVRAEEHGSDVSDALKGRDFCEEDWKQGWTRKNSPNFCKITSIIDRTTGSTNFSEEPSTMKLSEDLVAQLLSGFWIQANLPDNLPANFEALANSYSLVLISLNLKNTNQSLIVCIFQLPLSLRKVSLEPHSGMLPPTCRRSILVMSTAMLMFAAKMYHMHALNDLLGSVIPYDVDPYLGIREDLQLYIKPQIDVRQYGSASDNQAADLLLSKVEDKKDEAEKVVLDVVVQHLAGLTKMQVDDLLTLLLEPFPLDDAFLFVSQSTRDLDHIHMVAHPKESPSLDGELSANSLVEDDVTSVSSVTNIPHYVPKVSPSPSMSHIVSIGKLLESALEVAGQVVGTSVSTSPLPYSALASQCEALGAGTRKKLSSWLSPENQQGRTAERPIQALPSDETVAISKITSDNSIRGSSSSMDRWSTLRLPPASPFDNFLRSVSSSNLERAQMVM
ncbi:hypothetical protein Ancab_000584 [Ancistrocladus abbreviatus]